MATKIRYGEIAMMGEMDEQTGLQVKIFYPHLNLEQIDQMGSNLYSLLKKFFFRLIKNAQMQGSRNSEE